MLSVGAWADNVAQIGTTEYATLQEAFDAATTTQTVQLIANVELANWLNVNSGKDVTLDLNGHTIAPTVNREKTNYCIILVHRGAKLTIDDSSTEKNGCIDGGTAYYGGILLTKNDDSGSEPATLVVNNGTIKGDQAAITGNGNRHNTNVTINGGTFTATSAVAGSEGCAIYHPQDGTLTINGGTFSGYSSSVEIRSGILNITGGSFTATASEYSCKANNNGSTTIGAALAIAQHTTQKNIAVNISSGTFSGVKAVSEANPQGNPTPQIALAITDGTFTGDITAADVTNFISGGTFSTEVSAEYCATGFEPVSDGEGHYIVGHYVAQIDEKKYQSLADAITVATEGQTITLIADHTLSSDLTISADKNFTLDLNGKVLSLEAKFYNNGTLVVKSSADGGKITRSSTVIYNYSADANFTLQSGTLEATGNTTNGVINSKGTLTINGGEVVAKTYAIRTAENATTTVTINGGSITTEGENAIYMQYGKCDITGGTITSLGKNVLLYNTSGLKATVAVSSNAVTTLSDGYSYALIGALACANAGETITLTNDSELTTEATVAKNVTLALNGHNILSTKTALKITAGTLTITGEGTVKGATNNAKGSKSIFYPAVYANGGNVVINGGTYDDGGVDGYGFPTIYADGSSTVTINNGTFKNSATSQGDRYWVLNTKDGSSASIIVRGGKFYNFDPANNVNDVNPEAEGTNYVADGYITEMTESGSDKIYTVKEGQWAAKIEGGVESKFRFASLDDAVTTANEADKDITITLLTDAVATVEPAANVTIDAHGKALTLPTFNVADGAELSYAKVINATDNTYTVTTATYNRTGATGTQWGTACLPFSFESAPEGYTLYIPSEVSAETLTVTEATYPVAVGTPVIFHKENTGEATITSENAQIKIGSTPAAQSGDDIHLVGTYSAQTITEGLTSIYFINGDKFHQAKASLTVPAYRAYIQNTSAGARAAVLSINVDGEATAIESLVSDMNTATAIYDLNGRQLAAPQKGINIMKLANGKSVKVIR